MDEGEEIDVDILETPPVETSSERPSPLTEGEKKQLVIDTLSSEETKFLKEVQEGTNLSIRALVNVLQVLMERGQVYEPRVNQPKLVAIDV